MLRKKKREQEKRKLRDLDMKKAKEIAKGKGINI
jgi:hypothetical protein